MNKLTIDPELIPAIAQLKTVLGETACFNLDELNTARATVSAMEQASLAAAPERSNILIETLSISDETLDTKVNIKLYRSNSGSNNQAAIIYLHGGGYVLGSMQQAHSKLSGWCEELDLTIVSVDYRLAPEHPFPAGLLDSFAVLKWLYGNAAKLGVDGNRIGLVGDSAGGGLAAGLSLYVRDHSTIKLAFQCLLYPMLDHTNVDPAPLGEDRPLWSNANNKFAWQAYMGSGVSDDMLQYAAPITATNLKNLAPTYIAVGDQDLFYAENKQFSEALTSAAVETQLEVYPGGYHGFPEVAPNAALSKKFNADLIEALLSAL